MVGFRRLVIVSVALRRISEKELHMEMLHPLKFLSSCIHNSEMGQASNAD